MKKIDTSALSSFSSKADRFMELTEGYIHEGVNPGGYYKAVWCRDASYILKDWFLSGRMQDVMQELLFIWSHQITPAGEKLVYGRGSPEMKYLSQVAKAELQKKFVGALPTTIFHGFSEVYGRDPDIDSTALMISTTSWILDAYLKAGLISSSDDQTLDRQISSVVSDPSAVANFVVPRMLKAVDYLASRDIDGDSLLEQGHNEDWMDTVLRAGKIVYSQACWVLALSNLSSLLSELKNKDAQRMMSLANKAITAVERHLWSEEDGAYIDIQKTHHIGGPYRTLTQDVSLYVIAVTENTMDDIMGVQLKNGGSTGRRVKPDYTRRVARTLDAIKSRVWKGNWPLVTEIELKTTGPWILHPNQYHNHTFWPWTTGIEMQARSRLHQFGECDLLMSTLSKGDHDGMLAFYEWINPVTGRGDGAFPFRTGISAIRIAIADILSNINVSNR
jgi:glycogen debranching enzyme